MPVAAHQAMAPTTTKANAPANLAAIKARSAQFQDYFSAPAPGLNRSAVAIDKLMGASANSGDASAHTALADATNGTANQIFAIYGHPAHRRSAVADDEAGQFDVRRSVTPSKHSRGAESGIGPIRSDSYGLSASHSGGPPPGLNLPNRRVVEHRQRRHQFARHSLSSWPPSPGDAMPPMPTFIVSSPHIKNDPTQRASYSNIPPAGYQGARAKKPQANESSLISGGNARVATTASYQAAPHAESPSPDSPVTTATSTEPAPRTSATKPLVPSPATEAAIRRAVPSPTELLRVANESARSSAATYLSDWVSEVVWEMCVPIMGVNGYVLQIDI
ncbi:hypothetical protein DL93DRAFT_116571 [Clavulina sp. PMI_390]|nr:hypothetical protein DL93DRAFT_116571 [Clavulina sp. PMI_390]